VCSPKRRAFSVCNYLYCIQRLQLSMFALPRTSRCIALCVIHSLLCTHMHGLYSLVYTYSQFSLPRLLSITLPLCFPPLVLLCALWNLSGIGPNDPVLSSIGLLQWFPVSRLYKLFSRICECYALSKHIHADNFPHIDHWCNEHLLAGGPIFCGFLFSETETFL